MPRIVFCRPGQTARPRQSRGPGRALLFLSFNLLVAGLGCAGPGGQGAPGKAEDENRPEGRPQGGAVAKPRAKIPARVVNAASAWPQFLGPRRDGVWSDEGVLKAFPEKGLY